MGGLLIEEDLRVKYSIIDKDTPEGQKIHDFLYSRAQALVGHIVDFEQNPVTFVMSDDKEPNAFFVPHPDKIKKPQKNKNYNQRHIKIPYDSAVISVTKGLIEFADNLDQLDYVLGHELTHMMIEGYLGHHFNSKGEEELADLHAADLLYDAGGDPKQALKFAEKLNDYAEEKKWEDAKKKRRSRRDEEEEKTKGVNWSEILDVHMTDANRISGLEASLTRLSHLIDEREPSDLDYSVFAVEYSDPVDAFLKEQGFDQQKSLGQLKILIDCVDHLSSQGTPAAVYFQRILDDLPENDSDNEFLNYETARLRAGIQKIIDGGYKHYFHGKTIEKKYQQKIAALSESVIEKAKEEKNIDEDDETNVLNTKDLNVYLHNAAYKHIKENGYPKEGDVNYEEASGLLYTYFYYLLSDRTSWKRRRNHQKDLEEKRRTLPQIEIDINATKARILNAQKPEDFTAAAEEFRYLTKIYKDLRSHSYGKNGRFEKFDNLSFIPTYYHDDDNDPVTTLYPKLQAGHFVLWNNLVDIAQTDDETKEYVVNFLQDHRIEDFRITHEKPYIRQNSYSCFAVNKEGRTSDRKVPQYEVDYVVNKPLVLESYAYIKNYFEQEAVLFDNMRENLVSLTEEDFTTFDDPKDEFNERSVADKAIYSFVELYNSLPAVQGDKKRYYEEDDISDIGAFLPKQRGNKHPLPAVDEDGKLLVDRELFNSKTPIFRAHFGKGYKKQIIAAKKKQRQKMFDASFSFLEKTLDIWLESKTKLDELRARKENLWEEIRNTDNEAFKEQKHKERELLDEEIAACQKIEYPTGNAIYNFSRSIFEKNPYWFQLQRLTAQQKKQMAEYVVKDEKGTFIKMLESRGYEHVCDYLNILEQQTERAIAGDYEQSALMKIIADNYTYENVVTSEDFAKFVEEKRSHKYGRNEKKYEWYLAVFDAMAHLETSREIDVKSLAIALTEIEQDEQSHWGDDPESIVTARYDNYRTFVNQSRLVTLVSPAINHRKNYKNLSVDGLIETADALIAMRETLAKAFDGKSDYDYSGDHKSQTTPAQHKFVRRVDKKIRGLIRQAEHQALQQDDDKLERIINLYRVYHSKKQRHSSATPRQAYLNKMTEKEKSREKISALSENPAFWPDDALEHVKAYVFAKNTFLDDIEFENKLLNDILDKVEALWSGKKKNECFFVLLDKNLRASFPETRERLFDLYAQDLFNKLGPDDTSERYQKRLAIQLAALESDKEKSWDIGKDHGDNHLLSNAMAIADKYLLLRKISGRIVSQEQTSEMIKTASQVNLNAEELVKSYLYGIGVDYLTSEMDNDPDMANRFIAFLNAKGENQDCEDMSAHIKTVMMERYNENKSWHRDRLKVVLENTKPLNLKVLYENFWSAPLEARAVIIARMLKSAVKADGNKENEGKAENSWERVFDVVMDTVISPTDTSQESAYARDIMHSYIGARSDYERELILSAMMVANRNIGQDAGNVGKALKLFLENMGPAEIKLGQAIASHPHTPQSIRDELQELKNAADKPARWTLYDWIKNENIPEELWKNKHLGAILGSASYYTSVALGGDKVLRILRPEAREKAAKGFKVIGATIDDLKEKDKISDLDYRALTASVSEMVKQAARMSSIETDHDIGQTQYEEAQELYNGVQMTSGSKTFSLKVMDWRAKGKNWIVMDRAKGPTFNALPENTPAEQAYKKSFAKAYISFEIQNIISGGRFDHDRHGAQLCIDPETNEVGIFDTGAMALNDPSPEEQRVLGNMIYGVIKQAIQKEEQSFARMSGILGDKIEELHTKGIDTQYLVEVKKGLLALGDFFNVLDEDDVKALMPGIEIFTSLSAHIQAGVTEKMSLMEKAALKARLATQGGKAQGGVTIKRDFSAVTLSAVANVNTAPTTQRKASWLQTTFSNPEQKPNRRKIIVLKDISATPRHQHPSYN